MQSARFQALASSKGDLPWTSTQDKEDASTLPKTSRISACPQRAAKCAGVRCSRQPVRPWGSAAWASKISTTLVFPKRAAAHRGVRSWLPRRSNAKASNSCM
eukprot:scaffold1927_cov333-Pavlova_lutheri.AAC.9